MCREIVWITPSDRGIQDMMRALSNAESKNDRFIACAHYRTHNISSNLKIPSHCQLR